MPLACRPLAGRGVALRLPLSVQRPLALAAPPGAPRCHCLIASHFVAAEQLIWPGLLLFAGRGREARTEGVGEATQRRYANAANCVVQPDASLLMGLLVKFSATSRFLADTGITEASGFTRVGRGQSRYHGPDPECNAWCASCACAARGGRPKEPVVAIRHPSIAQSAVAGQFESVMFV